MNDADAPAEIRMTPETVGDRVTLAEATPEAATASEAASFGQGCQTRSIAARTATASRGATTRTERVEPDGKAFGG